MSGIKVTAANGDEVDIYVWCHESSQDGPHMAVNIKLGDRGHHWRLWVVEQEQRKPFPALAYDGPVLQRVFAALAEAGALAEDATLRASWDRAQYVTCMIGSLTVEMALAPLALNRPPIALPDKSHLERWPSYVRN